MQNSFQTLIRALLVISFIFGLTACVSTPEKPAAPAVFSGSDPQNLLGTMHRRWREYPKQELSIRQYNAGVFSLFESDWAVNSLAQNSGRSITGSKAVSMNYKPLWEAVTNFCLRQGGAWQSQSRICDKNGYALFGLELSDYQAWFTKEISDVFLVSSLFVPQAQIESSKFWGAVNNYFKKMPSEVTRTWTPVICCTQTRKISVNFWQPITGKMIIQAEIGDLNRKQRNDARKVRQEQVRSIGTNVCGLIYADARSNVPMLVPYMLYGVVEQVASNKIQIRVSNVMVAAGPNIKTRQNLEAGSANFEIMITKQWVLGGETPRISGNLPGDLAWWESARFDSQCPVPENGEYRWESPYQESA